MMKYRMITLCSLVFGLALLAGCSPARTGLTGSTLSTNTHPPISITANAPFKPVASGNLWVMVPNDTEVMSSSMASFNYAVFGDGSTSGPVTRHAHAIISRLSDSSNWYFAPDTWKAPDAISGVALSGGMNLGGYAWSAQLLRIPSQGEWFSDFWVANGRGVPKLWLAKRWTANLNSSNRAVIEYREPWPDCLQNFNPDLMIVGGDAGACLSDFEARAGKVFTASAQETPLNDMAPAQALQARPAHQPDAKKLLGEARATGRRAGSGSKD